MNNNVNKDATRKTNGLITVIAQAFYGNRTGTRIKADRLDMIILGHIDSGHDEMWKKREKIDRTIIKLPDTDCVLIYNKYQEEETRNKNKKYFEKDGYVAKPLAFIPEQGIEIYSRCIVSKIDETGTFVSIDDDDYDKVIKYLAE